MERCLERSDVWSGAKLSAEADFLLEAEAEFFSETEFLLDAEAEAEFLLCVVFSGLSLLPVAAVHVASVSLSLFLSLLAIGESGGKGWISCCRVTTESYIIEL